MALRSIQRNKKIPKKEKQKEFSDALIREEDQLKIMKQEEKDRDDVLLGQQEWLEQNEDELEVLNESLIKREKELNELAEQKNELAKKIGGLEEQYKLGVKNVEFNVNKILQEKYKDIKEKEDKIDSLERSKEVILDTVNVLKGDLEKLGKDEYELSESIADKRNLLEGLNYDIKGKLEEIKKLESKGEKLNVKESDLDKIYNELKTLDNKKVQVLKTLEESKKEIEKLDAIKEKKLGEVTEREAKIEKEQERLDNREKFLKEEEERITKIGKTIQKHSDKHNLGININFDL